MSDELNKELAALAAKPAVFAQSRIARSQILRNNCMKVTRVAIMACGLALLAQPVYAQNDTFTQVGAWEYYVPPGAPEPVICPPVKFSTEFGGTPNVVIIPGPFLGKNGMPLWYHLKDVTPQGFTPVLLNVLSRGPNGPPERTSGSYIAVGPRLLRGTATANYLVLTVIYAPPGTNGGHSTSSVAYQAGSTTGTTTSASQSFKSAYSLSIETSGGFLGNGGGAGISFEYSPSGTDSQSLEIKKSTTSTITQVGPSQDGINHDEDEIWLLLNPTVNLALSPSSAAWMLANTQSPIQYVHVGWLNGHQTMPAGVATALQSAGITAQDYPNILARDPLASGSSFDPRRFVSLNTTFPYEPPYSQTDPVPTVAFNATDSSIATTGSAVEETYKVGLSMHQSGDYLEFAKATLKETTSWEWTNKSSQSSASGTLQSASVTVGGPAYGYNGDTVMRVYFDTMYKTFAFRLVPFAEQEIGVEGTVVSAAGTPLAATEVILVENQIKYRTFTSAKGEFRFFGHITGPAKVQAAGVTQLVPQLRSRGSVELRVP